MSKITPKQFQERYSVSLSTQYRWRKANKVPFFRVGKSILYTQDIIDIMAIEGKLNKNAYLAIEERKEKR